MERRIQIIDLRGQNALAELKINVILIMNKCLYLLVALVSSIESIIISASTFHLLWVKNLSLCYLFEVNF